MKYIFIVTCFLFLPLAGSLREGMRAAMAEDESWEKLLRSDDGVENFSAVVHAFIEDVSSDLRLTTKRIKKYAKTYHALCLAALNNPQCKDLFTELQEFQEIYPWLKPDDISVFVRFSLKDFLRLNQRSGVPPRSADEIKESRQIVDYKIPVPVEAALDYSDEEFETEADDWFDYLRETKFPQRLRCTAEELRGMYEIRDFIKKHIAKLRNNPKLLHQAHVLLEYFDRQTSL